MVSSSAALLVCALVSSGETALYEFKADWCAPCRQMSPVVQQLTDAGYPVREIDVEQDRAATQRFGVGPLPCFVLVVDGKEVDRVVGLVSESELTGMLRRAGVSPSENGGLTEVAKRSTRSDRAAAPGVDPFTAPAPTAQPPLTQASPTAAGPQDVLAVSARLRIEDATGQSYGSGTVIDSRNGEALIITCGHVFRESQGQGNVVVDLFCNGGERGLSGQVIGYDLERDLGFVAVRTNGEVPFARVAPRESRSQVGETVCSVGCNGGQDPTVMTSRVTAIDKYLGPPNIQASGLPVQGRSGGGLFNARGELIGVCNAADPEDQEGLYAALGTIYAEIDRLQLGNMIGGGETPAMLANVDNATVRPISHETPTFDAPNQAQAEMAAALADHQEAEVICIVRSLRDPRAKSNVIVLDRASPDFLAKLTAEQSVQDSRTMTSDRQSTTGQSTGAKAWRPSNARSVKRTASAPVSPRR